MNAPIGPITVRDAIDDINLRRVLEERLKTPIVAQANTPGGDTAVVGKGHTQGGFVGQLETGETVFFKRSDRSADNAELGDAGKRWVRNEVAAWRTAKVLGLDDLVIPTVHQWVEENGEIVEIAVRLLIEGEPGGSLVEGGPLNSVDDDDLARAAMFDLIVEQSDRRGAFGRSANYYILTPPDAASRLLLFDHQLCYGANDGKAMDSAIYDHHGHRIKPFCAFDRRKAVAQLRKELATLLDAADLAAVCDRVTNLPR